MGFTFNPVLSEIQSHLQAMSPPAQAAVKMANPSLPSPGAISATQAPSVIPPGMLLPHPEDGPTPGPISMPSNPPPLMPSTQPSVKAPLGTVEGDTNQRGMLLSQKPGVDNIYHDVTRSPLGQAHPFLGKLLGGIGEVGGKIGDTLANGLPGIGREIPGTTVNHNMLLGKANTALNQDVSNAQKEAQTANENATAEARLNPPEKPQSPEEWTTLKLPTGDLLTGPGGQVIQQNKAGELRAQPLPTGETLAPKPATSGHTAFDEWSADPQKFESFQKSMADIKAQIAAEHPTQAKNSSFMNVYAAQRFLQMAYTHNPALLPVASQMIGKLLNLTPEQTAEMGKIPTDQPLSPVTGEPIGTSMPSAPTGGTRSQAQTAQRALDEIPRIRQSITQLGNELGPVLGRWNEFETGKIGAGDPRYETLRTDLTFLNSAAAKFHLNSVRAVQEFQHLAQAGKMTPQVLNGYINAVQNWATTAAKQERGAGETQQPPSGATELEIGPDGKLRAKGGK